MYSAGVREEASKGTVHHDGVVWSRNIPLTRHHQVLADGKASSNQITSFSGHELIRS